MVVTSRVKKSQISNGDPPILSIPFQIVVLASVDAHKVLPSMEEQERCVEWVAHSGNVFHTVVFTQMFHIGVREVNEDEEAECGEDDHG